ncbi:MULTISPECIES: hypothetical protein [unclassified Mesorhizobium]|uniref:hypothetical protein n=1 Tax=unclassified Mesorhizobium TaxID=325217 RepID=UPI001CCBA17B|nr:MULTISPECIES: hypothetical protein [unclassified Mesorhizobium]MBZ9741104.1 hypothetical protein [Mesorhizobium sp. CO1-1-4]MBZ9804288.1 hypothetical protein [Mesorhizobium sp. ES1-6]MBZ9996044.1 hypothetical protein [Mesorhizobium sp. BH1-1-4]
MTARQARPGVDGKRVEEKPPGPGMRMAGSMADKQVVKQSKTRVRPISRRKRLPWCMVRDFLAESALSRMRRFPVAN